MWLLMTATVSPTPHKMTTELRATTMTLLQEVQLEALRDPPLPPPMPPPYTPPPPQEGSGSGPPGHGVMAHVDSCQGKLAVAASS